MSVYWPTPLVLAEVSDKIPSKGAFIVICVVSTAIVCLFAASKWLWPMLLEFTIILAALAVLSGELVLDERMRRAILHEQGLSYYVIASVALLTPLVAGMLVYCTAARRTGRQADER